MARYLNSTAQDASGKPQRLLSPVYVYCRQSVRAHLKAALDARRADLETLQALTIVAAHKGPGEDSSCVYLERVSYENRWRAGRD